MTNVLVSQAQYDKMSRQLALLEALENAGVDNWEGYEYATKDWRKQGELERVIDDAISAIDDVMSEAEVDYPAGCEAGSRVSYDDAQVRVILRNLIAQASELPALPPQKPKRIYPMSEITDEMVAEAMNAFVANVRKQDPNWTDEVEEGEYLLLSPDGDFFALEYAIRDALAAALSRTP